MASNEKKLVREQLRRNRTMRKELNKAAATIKEKKMLLKKEHIALSEKAMALGLKIGKKKQAA